MVSLTKRIFRILLCVTLLVEAVCFALAVWILNDAFVRTTSHALANQALLLKQLADASGASPALFDGLGNQEVRVTLIAADGSVLYDTNKATENHADRPEVVAALSVGEGTASRYSDTFSEVAYYHALLLNDGSVLRVATSQSQTLTALVALALPGVVILILLVILSFIFTRKLAISLATPLLELNLDAPLDNQVYQELEPLLNRMEEQRIRLANQVADAEQTRRELTANVSHELKTPLTVISGYAELMKNGQVAPEDVAYFSDLIYSESGQMQQLVEDLLVLSQLDEEVAGSLGKTAGDRHELVELRALASGVIDRLTPFAEQQNISFRLQAEGDCSVSATRRMLESLVYNLCENAIRYNYEGGQVTVEVAEKPEGIELKICDTGIGIALNEQQRVFERFYRIDKAHSRKTGGTGLGLAIVKHAARAHNAQLELQSVPGQGTTVTVLFPHPA